MQPLNQKAKEAEVREVLKGHRNDPGVQAALMFAHINARRAMRAMTRCAPADFLTYQGAFAAYETMIVALGGKSPTHED